MTPSNAESSSWPSARRVVRFSRAAPVACAFVGLVVVAGWIAGAPALTTFGRLWTPMVVSTAVSIVLASAATLLVTGVLAEPTRSRLVRAFGALIAGNALVVLANFASEWLRDAPLFVTGPAWRMAPTTALAFALLGGALILIVERSDRRNSRLAETFVAGAFILATVMLLAFLYGATPVSELMGRVNMSPLTGLCLAVLSASLLAVMPDGWLIGILSGREPGSQVARRMLPIALVGPVVLGFLRLEAERQGLIRLEYGVATMVIATMLLVSIAVLWGAAHVNRGNADRRRELELQTFLTLASDLLSSSLDLNETLSAVADVCVPQLADWCSITLVQRDGSLETVCVVHQDPEKVTWAREYEKRFPPKPDDPTGAAAVVRTGKPEFYPDIPDALLAAAIPDPEQLEVIRALGMRSAISVPLMIRGRAVGVLSLVTSESRRRYTTRDLHVAQQLADRCATAIEHARLYGELQRELARRELAEASQRRAFERYRTLFESSPLPMCVVDMDTLGFLAVNESAVAHYGYSVGEFLGMTLRDIRLPEDADILTRQVADLADSERRVHSSRHRLKDGTVIDVEVTSSAMQIEGRRARLAVMNDMTARNQAEASLRALTGELEQRVAQRTAELGVANRELESFAYSVSHDLRTPLRALDGFSQALLEDYADRLDGQGQDYLRRIRKGSQRMGDLIDALLDLSRVSRGQLQRERVDLTSIATDIVASLRERTPDRPVKADVQPGMVTSGDPRLLRALLQNLLANAWKFTARRPDARIEFAHHADNGRSGYVVRDNGVGFDMAYAPKLFGAFQRLHSDRDFEGTGVGLATAQRIVHRHGGEIWAESVPDQGAAFYFTLS